MIIIGCDYHPGFQQIAFVDKDTGEFEERRLEHREEADKFYRDLGAQGAIVRVGMEASGHARWFEGLLSELQFELWIGDAAEIRTKRVRKQKTDRQELHEVIQEAKRMANEIQKSSDLWDLEHHLTQRRKEIDRKYDFRGSRLTDVLGRLLYENRLGEEDLRGLREEKMKSIRSFAQFLRDGAA
jgi:hypothetical protein